MAELLMGEQRPDGGVRDSMEHIGDTYATAKLARTFELLARLLGRPVQPNETVGTLEAHLHDGEGVRPRPADFSAAAHALR